MDEYFKHRKVAYSEYKNSKLSPWISIETALLDKNNAKLLDFGCGLGQNIELLESLGFRTVYGVEIDPFSIEHNISLGRKVYNSIEELAPLKFDLILCNHVLEHIPKDRVIDTISNLMKLLSDNGVLCVSVPNAQSNTGCYWAYEDFTHHTLFTTGSLYSVFSKAGYNNVEFVDLDGTTFVRNPVFKIIKKALVYVYKTNYKFWNFVTSSFVHKPSELCFTYEIKAKVRKNT